MTASQTNIWPPAKERPIANPSANACEVIAPTTKITFLMETMREKKGKEKKRGKLPRLGSIQVPNRQTAKLLLQNDFRKVLRKEKVKRTEGVEEKGKKRGRKGEEKGKKRGRKGEEEKERNHANDANCHPNKGIGDTLSKSFKIKTHGC